MFLYIDHIFQEYSRLYFLCFCSGYFLVEVKSFQCFYFYLVSCYYFEFHFCFCFLNDCLYLVSYFISFFLNQASCLFLLAFLSLLGLFRYSVLELLRKKSSFLLNISIDISSSFVQSVSHSL